MAESQATLMIDSVRNRPWYMVHRVEASQAWLVKGRPRPTEEMDRTGTSPAHAGAHGAQASLDQDIIESDWANKVLQYAQYYFC